MSAWVARFRRTSAPSAAELRQTIGLEVAEAEGFVWVRGSELDEAMFQRLRCLPLEEFYEMLPDGQLVVHGMQVPTLRLPEADWMDIRDWFEVELPPVRWPGKLGEQVPLRLVRSDCIIEADVIVVTIDEWLAYGQNAPQIRLQRLTFAACRDGRIVVRGMPLPPLRGDRYVSECGVAVAVGWHYEPPVDASIVSDALQLIDGDVALLDTDGSGTTVEVIRHDQFVRATRSAIRSTAEVVTNG